MKYSIKLLSMFSIILAMCVSLSSCSDDDVEGVVSSKKLVGIWTSDYTWTNGVLNLEITFNSNGTYEAKYGVYYKDKGRYSYKHPNLTLSSETGEGTSLYTIISFEKDYFVMMSGNGNVQTLHKGAKEGEKLSLSGTVNNQDFVDLGLSVEWANCNVGANKPTESGNLYAWGETKTKEDFTWPNYKWCYSSGSRWDYLTKYVTQDGFGKLLYEHTYFKDKKNTLEILDDAAYVNWGSGWRIPTKEEYEELYERCTWKLTSLYGYVVWKVTGPSGKSIFFVSDWPDEEFKSCYYWTSTLDEDWNDSAWSYYIGNNSVDSPSSHSRECGFLVRPVRKRF